MNEVMLPSGENKILRHIVDRSDKRRADVVRWNRSREIRCGRAGCSLNPTLDDIHDGACNGRRVERRSVGGHAYWVQFKSARVPTARFAPIVFELLPYPRFSFFARPNRSRYSPSAICVHAHARNPSKKEYRFLAAASRGRIPRARITRWGYLPSISSLAEKIVLRACFGSTSITARRNASEQLRDKNVARWSLSVTECRINWSMM